MGKGKAPDTKPMIGISKPKAESTSDTKPKIGISRVAKADQSVPRQAKRKTKKKGKRKKDPNAPRRPATAFIRFSQAARPRIIEQNPQASFAEIGRLLGQAWREAPAQERMQYHGEEYHERAEYRRRHEPPEVGRPREDGRNDVLIKRCAEAELKMDARHQILTDAKPEVAIRPAIAEQRHGRGRNPPIEAGGEVLDGSDVELLGEAKMRMVSDYIDLTDS